MYNINQLVSYAFKNHCSFIGGKPYSNVLNGTLGQLVFFFNPKHKNNIFFQWIRYNHDSSEYSETTLIYRNTSYSVIFLKIPQFIQNKFLHSFKIFVNKSVHLVNY